MRKGYSTPHIVTLNGKPTLLSSGAMAHYAYIPLGRELWRVWSASNTVPARVRSGHGLCYFLQDLAKAATGCRS